MILARQIKSVKLNALIVLVPLLTLALQVNQDQHLHRYVFAMQDILEMIMVFVFHLLAHHVNF